MNISKRFKLLSKLKIHRGRLPEFLLGLLLLFCAWGMYMADIRDNTPSLFGREIDVLIVPGQNAREIAEEFQRMGVVAKSRDLVVWMKRLGIDRKLKPGWYRIHSGYPKDVAKELSTARPEVIVARISPGALFEDVAATLKRKDRDVLLGEALENPNNFPEGLRALLPKSVEGRVIFLAPETYVIDPGEECADHLVQVASRAWWRQHGEDIPEGITSKELEDDGILASIVQREALLDSERPMIAAVFKNRLKRNMHLQSCATVVHAWKLQGVRITSVSYNDLKIASPFNTYINRGLPPESIGIPSESSWHSVLKPIGTDKLFFVAKGDGSHIFTKTYKEHLAVQRRIEQGR